MLVGMPTLSKKPYGATLMTKHNKVPKTVEPQLSRPLLIFFSVIWTHFSGSIFS